MFEDMAVKYLLEKRLKMLGDDGPWLARPGFYTPASPACSVQIRRLMYRKGAQDRGRAALSC